MVQKSCTILFNPYLFIYGFGHTRAACGTLFPDQESDLHLLHWKCRVLTTRPPGKFLCAILNQCLPIYAFIGFLKCTLIPLIPLHLYSASLNTFSWRSYYAYTGVNTDLKVWEGRCINRQLQYTVFFKNWSVDFQCWANLCCTAKWLSYTHIHIFFFFIFFSIMVYQRIFIIVPCAIHQGFPNPRPWTTGTGPWPVRNQAAQQEVSEWSSLCIYSYFPSLTLPPELCLLSDHWWHNKCNTLETSPQPHPWKICLPWNWCQKGCGPLLYIRTLLFIQRTQQQQQWKQIIQLKKGQKAPVDISPKTYRWPAGIWKAAQHH